VPAGDLSGLRLDPRLPTDLSTIVALQLQLVEFSDLLQSFVALIDVPPGLSQRQILAWRTAFSSSYAAAYHPWLLTAPADDPRNVLVSVPPSAAAAGIIAQSEVTYGVPHGPANVLVADAVDVADVVSPARQDALHPLGINVYLRDRDGIRLTAARTLSSDPDYRQLSVRRLMTLLRRTLLQKMQWVVFEPNATALRNEVRQMLRRYLRQLYAAGAFVGDTESEAFFVRCDESNNPPQFVEAGQLLVEVGVAPARPTEFILVRLWANADGSLVTQE
jgi:phage tail sheath protein FI